MLKKIMLAALIGSSLTACGLKGNLETPPPIFGEPDEPPAEYTPED